MVFIEVDKKKVILIACALLCIVGCQKNIVERNAIEISVENLKNNQIRKIVNENEIVTITDKINSSEKDFLIFKPDVKLVFTYSNGNKKIVLVKKNMLKIDGISYINKSDNDYLPFNFYCIVKKRRVYGIVSPLYFKKIISYNYERIILQFI